MPRKRNRLHVGDYLTALVDYLADMQERNERGEIHLAPIDQFTVAEFKLVAGAILRKHAKKNTRKDIQF